MLSITFVRLQGKTSFDNFSSLNFTLKVLYFLKEIISCLHRKLSDLRSKEVLVISC